MIRHGCNVRRGWLVVKSLRVALFFLVLIVAYMQKILSTFDVAPCYHEEYRNVMERFVAAFDKPVPLFGWTPEGARIVMGHVTTVEKRGVDLFGTIAMMPEHTSYMDKNHVHMSWFIGGAHGIGLSEGHFSPHPHATNYDFAEDDGDDF